MLMLLGPIGFALGTFVSQPAEHEASVAEETRSSEETGSRAARRERVAEAAVAPKRRKVQRPFLVRPPESCPAEDTEHEQAYRRQQSRELTDLLRYKVSTLGYMNDLGGPEAVVNTLAPWLMGWADALTRTAPDLVEELATEFEGAMCDPESSPATVAVISRVIGHMPELGNSRGIDCVVEREEEGAALWGALDAWRMGALPKTPALAKLEETTTDERILSRLVKFDDAAQQAGGSMPPISTGDEMPVVNLMAGLRAQGLLSGGPAVPSPDGE